MYSKLEEYLKRNDRVEGLFNGKDDGRPPGTDAMTDYLQRWSENWVSLNKDRSHKHDEGIRP